MLSATDSDNRCPGRSNANETLLCGICCATETSINNHVTSHPEIRKSTREQQRTTLPSI